MILHYCMYCTPKMHSQKQHKTPPTGMQPLVPVYVCIHQHSIITHVGLQTHPIFQYTQFTMCRWQLNSLPACLMAQQMAKFPGLPTHCSSVNGQEEKNLPVCVCNNVHTATSQAFHYVCIIITSQYSPHKIRLLDQNPDEGSTLRSQITIHTYPFMESIINTRVHTSLQIERKLQNNCNSFWCPGCTDFSTQLHQL